MKWSYGVTTVPSRRQDLLPRTLRSLAAAGFERPRLFVDGLPSSGVRDYEDQFGLPVIPRFPSLRTHGNWILGFYELFLREPNADRYAIFQDDLVACRNLRGYLGRSPYPEKGYLNLYTFSVTNEPIIKGKPVGWYEGGLTNPPEFNPYLWQAGRGAVGLVFSRPAALALLASPHMLERPRDLKEGWRRVDGGIVTAMNKSGYREYIHNPSLLQHTGDKSTMGNHRHKPAESFTGEDFDAMEFLR